MVAGKMVGIAVISITRLSGAFPGVFPVSS
jgi:hypothetical protein